MPFELILYLIIVICGLVITYQDFKSQGVSILPLLLFLISCSLIGITTKNFCYFPFLIFVIIGVGFYLWKKEKAFGMADYVAVLAVSFLISNDVWPFFLILSGSFGVLISVMFRNKKFPLLPGILAATMFLKIFGV